MVSRMDFYEYISPSRSGSKALQLAWDMFSTLNTNIMLAIHIRLCHYKLSTDFGACQKQKARSGSHNNEHTSSNSRRGLRGDMFDGSP
jgi:hypothetical protein